MPPRCKLPRRSERLGHNQCHGPFNFFPPFSLLNLHVVIRSYPLVGECYGDISTVTDRRTGILLLIAQRSFYPHHYCRNHEAEGSDL